MVLSTRHRVKLDAKLQQNQSQFVNLPLDVLIEVSPSRIDHSQYALHMQQCLSLDQIFYFLEPLDLLHLARTTIGLRAFLLNCRKSSALWKNAIGNIKDLPPCPDHMSAPAYTHLAFVPVCHGCSRPCEPIEWELRMRCCPNCFPEMTIPRNSILRNKPNNYLADLDVPMTRNHYKLNYDSGLDVTVSFGAVLSGFSLSLSDWRVVQNCKQPKKAESLKTILDQQNDIWGSIRRHARLCRKWEYGVLKEKATQLSLVRRERVEDIKDRLKDLGWVEPSVNLYYGYKFLQLPQVRKLEPLTPAEWSKIRPQLTGWLQGVKEEAACHSRLDVFNLAFSSVQQELSTDASLKVRPLVVDIVVLPAVRAMIESNLDSNMSHDDLKKKFFRILPLAFKKWSTNAVEELEQFAREELVLPPLSKPSCLPFVIFRCKECYCRMRFDEALSHQHLYKDSHEGQRNTRKTPTYHGLFMAYGSQPRDIRVLSVDINVSRRVENLVRRVGKNPNRVTYHELCQSTVKVLCGLCHPKVVTRMDFECAFEHCLNTHLKKRETEVWTRVSARE